MPALTFTNSDLALGVNTVLTLDQADMIASIDQKMSGWHDFDESRKVAELLKVYRQLKQICFIVKLDDNSELTFYLDEITVVEFLLMPIAFTDALGSAAMMTVTENQECDSSDIQRAEGIMQSRAGQQSHMYRPGMPMRTPIPRAAMDCLGRWLCTHNPTLGRAS